jgi:DNA-directed RNA polymerase specialized sigma24 family protein
MSIVHPFPLDGPVAFACAQAGCQVCLDVLMRQYRGLVRVVLRRQARCGVPYEELLQEGRIGLWQAILHFDPQRGVAFSTYAGAAIRHRIWRAVRQANRPQGWLPVPAPVNPLELTFSHKYLRERDGIIGASHSQEVFDHDTGNHGTSPICGVPGAL